MFVSISSPPILNAHCVQKPATVLAIHSTVFDHFYSCVNRLHETKRLNPNEILKIS